MITYNHVSIHKSCLIRHRINWQATGSHTAPTDWHSTLTSLLHRPRILINPHHPGRPVHLQMQEQCEHFKERHLDLQIQKRCPPTVAEIVWHPVEDPPSSRLSAHHSIQTTVPTEIPPFLYHNLLILVQCKSCSHGKPQGPKHRGKGVHLWMCSQPFHYPDLLVAWCSSEEFWGWWRPDLFGHRRLCNCVIKPDNVMVIHGIFVEK